MLAPSSTTSAKLRAQVVPQAPGPPTRTLPPAECEASCAHHRPVRLSWAKLFQAGVRDRRGALPELRRLAEDHCGDPEAAGDREDPHARGIAGAGTASCIGPWPSAASGLTIPIHSPSGGDRLGARVIATDRCGPAARAKPQIAFGEDAFPPGRLGQPEQSTHHQFQPASKGKFKRFGRTVPPLFCRARGAIGKERGV